MINDYINSRDKFKKELFDKLMIDRFGWDIWIEGDKFIIDASYLNQDEYNEKVKSVEQVVRYLLFEYDKYLFISAEKPDIFHDTPALLCVLSLSTEIHDSNTSEVYEVDPKTFERLEKLDGPIKDN